MAASVTGVREWERRCDMTQATTQNFITSQTIAVEHIRISSGRSFVEVRRKLESTVPKLDSGIAEVLQSGDQKRAKDYEENGPKLSIFGERDHGALLQIVGNRRHAVQYEIGNPLTASKMTRYQLPAALYAPLRVVLFEDEHGRGIFEYDRPSSFFGQYGDERVTEVGRNLDATLEARGIRSGPRDGGDGRAHVFFLALARCPHHRASGGSTRVMCVFSMHSLRTFSILTTNGKIWLWT